MTAVECELPAHLRVGFWARQLQGVCRRPRCDALIQPAVDRLGGLLLPLLLPSAAPAASAAAALLAAAAVAGLAL